MHTMWKGSISFGLVNIPVKMFAATEDKDIKFKYIHKECHTPIKYEKVCPACGREVRQDEIVRGYEYEPGRYVILEDSDFDSIRPELARAVEIVDFVKLEEIDPIYYAKTYYLSPQDTGGKAYHLLREAMNSTGRIAVARIAIREKQSLAVVRVYKNLLVLETIYYPDEVRDISLVPGIPENIKLGDAELKMATQLVENLTARFEPEKYKDDYREKLMELIRKKVEGEEVVVRAETQKTNIIDLMQALQASLQQTDRERVEKERAEKAAAGKEKGTVKENAAADGEKPGGKKAKKAKQKATV